MGAVSSSVLLLGNPVSRSLSPAMQNAAFTALGIDCRYMPREIDAAGLAGAVAELRVDERILGANVTIPHKEAVMALLDDLDAQAARRLPQRRVTRLDDLRSSSPVVSRNLARGPSPRTPRLPVAVAARASATPGLPLAPVLRSGRCRPGARRRRAG